MTGEKLLRTAVDAIFAKDKAQGSNNPDGYSIPATQYFTNKCAAAANKSPSEGAQNGSLFLHHCWLGCRGDLRVKSNMVNNVVKTSYTGLQF